MSAGLILVLLCGVAGAALIARLLGPRPRSKAGPEANWEQRLNESYPSLESNTDETYDNVEKGFNIAFKGGER